MSADVGLFHSSEVDDQSLLAFGWYIGIFTGEDLTTDGAIGPYETQADAACFEMGDGDDVIAGLLRRAKKNPRLAEALPRYIWIRKEPA